MAWAVDAKQALERRIDSRPRTQGFADVVQRAAALDPGAVEAGAMQDAKALAPVVDLARTARAQRHLDALVEDVQGQVEGMVAERVAGGVRRETRVPEPERPRRRMAIVAAVAVAAGLVAAIGLVTPSLLDRETVNAAADQAMRSGESAGVQGEVTVRDDPPARVSPPLRARSTAHAPAAAVIVPDTATPDEVAPPPSPEASPPRAKRRTQDTSKPSRQERVAALIAQAEKAWRAGELDEAERLLVQVTRIAGKRNAEQAYADLFSLARQRGDRSGEAARWRAYLGRFPGGRFADDARAGLCRRASADARTECWSRYLKAHPDGSFRAEAERATAKP